MEDFKAFNIITGIDEFDRILADIDLIEEARAYDKFTDKEYYEEMKEVLLEFYEKDYLYELTKIYQKFSDDSDYRRKLNAHKEWHRIEGKEPYTIERIDYDFTKTRFEIKQGDTIQNIYSASVSLNEDPNTSEIVERLNVGESVNGWSDGKGGTIKIKP